jgi:hypothetical protein
VNSDGDQPSIGIILCAEKDDVEVEYALRTKANPIGGGRISASVEIAGGNEGQIADGETARRCRADNASRKERPMTQCFHLPSVTPTGDCRCPLFEIFFVMCL